MEISQRIPNESYKLTRAKELGILRDGWRFVDYCMEAQPIQGWICNVRWGEKGSLKSYSTLCSGYQLFHGFDEYEPYGENVKRGITTKWDDYDAWRNVLKYTVFRPKDFSEMLRSVLKEGKRLTWVCWDDINIHFPRSMYSTNRRMWEQFSKNWEGFRGNLSIFECNAPRKDTVVSFILKDMNWDMLHSSRKKVEIHRWYWDEDYYEPEKVNKFRLDVEDEIIDRNRMPADIWKEYWDRKMALINESTSEFIQMLEEIDKPEQQRKTMQSICSVCQRDCGNNFNWKRHMSKSHPEISLA